MERNVYVGLDVHADTIAVATAEDGRAGEVRFQGVIENSADSILRLTKRLAAKGASPKKSLPSQFQAVRAIRLWTKTNISALAQRSIASQVCAQRSKKTARSRQAMQAALMTGPLHLF